MLSNVYYILTIETCQISFSQYYWYKSWPIDLHWLTGAKRWFRFNSLFLMIILGTDVEKEKPKI